MSSEQPLVSIITCCWNRGDALWETLNSVVTQTYDNWEHLCVDDMSKDNTQEILEAYAAKYPGKVRILQTHLVNGVKKMIPHNVGYREARGKYIQVLDHDDVISPDYLEKTVSRAEETQADVVIPDLVAFERLDGEKRKTNEGFKGQYDLCISGREAAMQSLDWQIHGFDLWRAEIAMDVLILEDEPCYDWGELAVRLRYMKSKIIAFSHGEYCYRKTPGGINSGAFRRYSHTRLTTNRYILRRLVEDHYPLQVVDAYRVATYRLFCASFARFVLSPLCRKDQESRRAIVKELRAYFNDPGLLDRGELSRLCRGMLDHLRLRFFALVVPITFWRKLVNRLLKREEVF